MTQTSDLAAPARDAVWPPKSTASFMAVMNQGPMTSTTRLFRDVNMIHLTPASTQDSAATLQAGDHAPDFELLSTDGRQVTLADFKGKPLVIRFTRAVSEKMVCPLCVPGLQDLNTSYADFEAAGLQVVIAVTLTPEQTTGMKRELGLNYPLYSDPAWEMFNAYGTGHILMAPKQAWVILDGDGVVRWTWRTGQDKVVGGVPMPREVLAVATDLFS